MSCLNCLPPPDWRDVPGCCSIAPQDEALADALWPAAVSAILELTGDCWQVCVHEVNICRPCRCPQSCSPCGCCSDRVQVPWTCGRIVAASSEGVALDPADWNMVQGSVWPSSCQWPCSVDLTIEVGDPMPDGLLIAAKTVLCRYVADCQPGCEVPPNATSITGPDGVSIRLRTLDQLREAGLFGVDIVDRMVMAYPCPKNLGRMLDPADLAATTVR